MSQGPQGIQGDQGAKGSRGPVGILGWGYGTTTGPTGSIGKSVVTPVDGSSTIVLNASNSGTIFRLTDFPFTQYEYQSVAVNITGLTGLPSGLFWIFNNNSLYTIAGLTSVGDFLFQLSIDDSETLVWNGTSLISI